MVSTMEVSSLAYLREQEIDLDEELVRRSVPLVQEKIAPLGEYEPFAGFLFRRVEPEAYAALESEVAELWPALLGSLSFRRSPCVRENCPACMSGDVTSMPSFTRSGRPSASFSSKPPLGRTSTALRVSSATAIWDRHYTPRILRFRRRRESPAPKKRRIRKRRLLVLTLALFILALSSFTFGLVTAIAGEVRSVLWMRTKL